MKLPNLLNKALTVVPKQTVVWFMQSGPAVVQSNGLKVTPFAAGVDVVGSFQPVPRNMFAQLGLEFNKDYVTFFTSSPFQDLTRNIAGDQFTFAGDRYQVMSNTEWMAVNGWDSSMAVKLTP